MDNRYNKFFSSNVVYMIAIAFLIMQFFIYEHFIIGFIFISLYSLLVFYNVKNARHKKSEWKKFIEDFSSQLDDATKSTLVRLPFPFVITSDNGNVLWYNQKFSSIFANCDILGKKINDIIKDLNVKYIIEGKKNTFKNVKLEDKYFDVYANMVEASETQGERLILAYLYEVTDIYQFKEKVKANEDAIMLIEVDNLDEVVKSIDEDKKPLLIAEIERAINSYAQNIKAMLKKYTTNKYVVILQERFVISEMEKKFEILDIVREINMGNKLAVTLSIGVGRGGDTPLANENYALSAKELALGRGGDQAVVKEGEKLDFFGGKTKEFEKRTKVRSRVIAHALVDLINESNKVFIMGHINSDLDCIGSSIGLYSIVKSLGKECYVVLNGVNHSIKLIMDKFQQDESYDGVFIDSKKAMELMNLDSLLILVDVHNKSYVQNIELVDKSRKFVIIDHHRRSSDFIEGALLNYIEPYASSASELVTEMIQYMVEKPKLKIVEAEALLAGICVDTKNFYFKTGVRTFEAASFLRRLGADTLDVKQLFADDLETYLRRAEIIKSAKVNKNIAIALCPPDIEDSVLAAQAADELLNITGIQASFVFVKIEDEIVISGRSLGNVNVQLILESLGGGGHMTMAGTRIKNVTIDKAVEMLQEAIDKYIMEGEEK